MGLNFILSAEVSPGLLVDFFFFNPQELTANIGFHIAIQKTVSDHSNYVENEKVIAIFPSSCLDFK